MLQVQRLAEYERYLGQEARNVDNSGGVGSGAVLQRGQLEGDLHRIQELFPGDNLRLHERDVLTTVGQRVELNSYIRLGFAFDRCIKVPTLNVPRNRVTSTQLITIYYFNLSEGRTCSLY